MNILKSEIMKSLAIRNIFFYWPWLRISLFDAELERVEIFFIRGWAKQDYFLVHDGYDNFISRDTGI